MQLSLLVRRLTKWFLDNIANYIYIYTVMARSRPTILSQMRLGQQFKVHANIALLLEKKGNSMHFWAQIGLAKLI